MKKTKQQSKVIDKSLNPKWDQVTGYINEKFIYQAFDVTVPSGAKGIEISVWDKDAVGKDEFMGRIILKPSQFEMAEASWIKLSPRDDSDDVKGDISVKLSLKK